MFKGGGREKEDVLLIGSVCGQYTDHFYINRLSNIQIGQTPNRVPTKKINIQNQQKGPLSCIRFKMASLCLK